MDYLIGFPAVLISINDLAGAQTSQFDTLRRGFRGAAYFRRGGWAMLLRNSDTYRKLPQENHTRGGMPSALQRGQRAPTMRRRIHAPLFVLFAAIATAAGMAAAHGQSIGDNKKAIRNDAFALMGAGISIPGMAAYCDKFVKHNPELLAAAKKWNERHAFILQRTVRAMEWSGGLTREEKRQLDQLAFKLAKQLIEDADDKVEFCKSIAIETNKGTLDLDRREDTAPAVKRLLKARF